MLHPAMSSAAQPSTNVARSTTNAHEEPERRSTGMSRSTALAYAKDVRLFIQAGGYVPCDAPLVLRYIAAMRQTIAPTTLHRRLMAIANAHRARGLSSPIDDPAVRPLVRALQLGHVLGKDLSIPTTKSKAHRAQASLPITRRLLGTVLEYMHRNMKDRRDRACLLLGFAAALKRSELAGLCVGDVRFSPDAMTVLIRNTRMNEDSEPEFSDAKQGRRVALALSGGELDAGRAVREWIEHAALEGDPGLPLFCRFDRGGGATQEPLSAAWIGSIVKHRLKAAGIDPSAYSAEGLRNGRRLEAAKGVIL